MGNEWTSGTAAEDGHDSRGWFVGKFVPNIDPRHSGAVETKWGVHTAGEARRDWAPGATTSTLTILVNGGPFRVEFPDDTVVVSKPGDYVLFGPGVAHTWEAVEDTVMLTVRWVEPSSTVGSG